MRQRFLRVSWALAILGLLAPGLAAMEPAKPAPAKAPLVVTYYYLPG